MRSNRNYVRNLYLGLVRHKLSCAAHTNESGIGKFTAIVFGAIFGALIYSGFKILPFYYYYYELLNQMDSMARVASTMTDKEIRSRLEYEIRHMQIPVLPEDLIVKREDAKIIISLEYQEEFYVSFKDKDYTIRVFPFHAYVERGL